MAVLIEAAVPDEHRVALESLAVRTKVSWQRFAADLLFAFDHEAQVDRRPPGSEHVLHRFHGGHVVALVVSRAAREELAVTYLWLERRRLPFFHWVRWLHVVVAVDREVGLSRPAVPVGDDDGKPALHHIDDLGLHAKSLEAISEPRGVAQTILAALRQGAYRWDTKFFKQV